MTSTTVLHGNLALPAPPMASCSRTLDRFRRSIVTIVIYGGQAASARNWSVSTGCASGPIQ